MKIPKLNEKIGQDAVQAIKDIYNHFHELK